jgi:A/G-specific adenine glycosylase
MAHHRRRGRDLPWRRTADPYAILVSEIMLQQTQVTRVTEKYGEFLRRFPDPQTLARAPLAEVLAVWQGLGYNRRAVSLHRLAGELVARHGGQVPARAEELEALPGVGAYTAAAVLAFAYNLPTVFIETNIRTVFIREFFPGREKVSDREILPLVARALPRRDPRTWYQALMDYGAQLKRRGDSAHRRSLHHRHQGPFTGSRRQARGKILRLLVTHGRLPLRELETAAGGPRGLEDLLGAMEREGLLRVAEGEAFLP